MELLTFRIMLVRSPCPHVKTRRKYFLCYASSLGNCVLRCSRCLFPTALYLVHPWTRTSCIPAVVLPKESCHGDTGTFQTFL